MPLENRGAPSVTQHFYAPIPRPYRGQLREPILNTSFSFCLSKRDLGTMSDEVKCPACNSGNTYFDSTLWVCPDCSNEWTAEEAKTQAEKQSDEQNVKDAFGNLLKDGDSITIIKDLKVKGSSSVVKVGTKVKSIRLVDSSDGHNIACKIDGIGQMHLKSEFVKKA